MGAVGSSNRLTELYDFGNWRLQDVKNAKDRVDASGHTTAGGSAAFMTRKEFWECFTDYHVIRQGQFLSVPLQVFKLFKNSDEKVNVVEVLLILALFCTGDVRQQLMFCFEMFDDDKSDSMDKDEMTNFLMVLAQAGHKAGLVDPMPTVREVQKVATGMFALADVSNSGTEAGLSSIHFINWAQNHIIGSAILDSVEKVREEESKHSGGAEMDAKAYANHFAATIMTREREKKLAGRKMLGNLVETTNFDVTELRSLRKRFEETAAKHEGRDGDNTTSQLDHLTKRQFCEAIVAAYPHLEGAADVNLESLFDTFDEDGGGTIDFKEFTLGVSKLTRGSTDQKIEFLFEIYDRNGDGTIDVAELLKFVQRGNSNLEDELRFTEQVIDALDKDGDGSISRAEFTKSLLDEPLLYECFSKALVVQGLPREAIDEFLMLASTNSKCTLVTLKRVWERCSEEVRMQEAMGDDETALILKAAHQAMLGHGDTAKHATAPEKAAAGLEVAEETARAHTPVFGDVPHENRFTDAATFHAFMRTNFGIMSDRAHELLDVMWDAVKPATGEYVMWKVIFSGLAQYMAGTMDDKASFYFSLYDGDGSGDMDKSEILGLILSSQRAAAAAAQQAVTLLQQLDQDGDGQITYAEFRAAAKAAPKVVECLRKLLGGDKSDSSMSDKGRIKALRQREMVRQVSSLFTTGSSSKLAKLKAAARKVVVRRNKRKGIQTLRRLSMTTLNTTVAALQGQHEEVSANTFSSARKVPVHYEVPAASMAAQVYSQQVSKRISEEAKAIRRDISMQHRQAQWEAQQAQQAAAATARHLRKTGTKHRLMAKHSSASALLHPSASEKRVQFAEAAGAVNEQPSVSSLASFASVYQPQRDRGKMDKNLAPRFRLRHTSSRRTMASSFSRPHTAAATSTPRRTKAQSHSAAFSPITSGTMDRSAAIGAARGESPPPNGGDLFSLGGGGAGSSPGGGTLRRSLSRHGSRRTNSAVRSGKMASSRSFGRLHQHSSRHLHTASGSRRMLKDLLQGSGTAQTSLSPDSAGSNVLPLRHATSKQRLLSSRVRAVIATSPSFRRGGSRVLQHAGSRSRLTGSASGASLSFRGQRRGGDDHTGASGADSPSLLEYGVGGALPQTVDVPGTLALTVAKKRATAKPHRSVTTRQVFGFRPN